jgi:hypothetical protein
MMRRGGASLLVLIWFAIGIVVALGHGYNTLKTLSQVVSFLLAVVLWPAVLLGYDLHITLLA